MYEPHRRIAIDHEATLATAASLSGEARTSVTQHQQRYIQQ
jgi:hypothetical protein